MCHGFSVLFIEPVRNSKKLWFLGDNFVANTYTNYFKRSPAKFPLTDTFDMSAYCSSKYSDKNVNMLSRIQVSLVHAINKHKYLPEYIVIVLDGDLIEFLNYKNYGVSTMLGQWIEWLCKEIDDVIKAKQVVLSAGAISTLQIYWANAVVHKGFDSCELATREKFNAALDSVVKLYPNMRSIKFKDHWSLSTSELVTSNNITHPGHVAYWWALDSAVTFNIKKPKEFLTRLAFRKLADKNCETSLKKQGDKFLQRRRIIDRYHWIHRERQQNHQQC